MAKMIWRAPNRQNISDGQSEEVEGESSRAVAMDKAEKDDEIEIKWNDGGWFAANLTPREQGIARIHFTGYSADDDDWDAEKFKSLTPIQEHIRVVSEILQDADCSKVSVNQTVCAMRRVDDSEGWYDAVVTEVRKRPHNTEHPDEICTCTFTVIWREGPGKGQVMRLPCEDICLVSTKDILTHPLIVDILRHVNGEGRGLDQEDDEGPSCSRLGVRKREAVTDDGLFLSSRSAELVRELSLSSHSADLIREIEAGKLADPKPSQQSGQAIESNIEDVSLFSPSAEEIRAKKKMRGQLDNESSVPSHFDNLRERLWGTNSTATDCKDKVQQKQAVPLTAEERRNEGGAILAPSESQLDFDIKENEAKVDPILEQSIFEDFCFAPTEEKVVEANLYSKQETAEILPATTSEAQQPSKKLRITVKIDVNTEILSILEEVALERSFPGAKVTPYSSNCEELVDSARKSGAKPKMKAAGHEAEAPPSDLTDCPPPEPKDGKKLSGSSVERDKGSDEKRNKELLGSVDLSFRGPKKNNPSIEPNVEEDQSKMGMRSRSRARSGNEEDLVDSLPRLGLAATNPICLSDEGDFAIPGSSIPPTSSPSGFANRSSISGSNHPFTFEQQGRNARLQNWARSTFHTEPGCILLIDNLEVNIRESDLMEQFLKFCDKGKIQSVTIPPLHPRMSHALGYVILVDKEAADAVEGVLANFLVVSARGRPWVLKRPGLDDPAFRRKDDNAASSGKFKVLTKNQLSESNGTWQRQRLFEEHLKQTRLMVQRHAQEEMELDADPDLSLYHFKGLVYNESRT